MKLLLDTHTFLWFIEGSLNLSDLARNVIEDQGNQRFLSVASLWEISIKVSMNKLQLRMPFTELVKREVYGNAMELLEIKPEHLDELAKLFFHHKDPFDRLIIAQSLAEGMAVITKDKAFESYPITILW
ncbi:twitching motility protein PilT [Moorena producens PAL-8-15-08-1]|uniref:Twitching motility protein PilT n=1 Tax=Moorena producens PAL-8-15-08-1 TaxID=1458985 RepID=A0A1D8U0Q1_9CYAN|nr:type II toxin-antitoxin system VapC family toxin [Moorena producens]AOX03487.1 twitching motility protein PilT [Moorena producens PAL-8-15-08-1]